MIVKWFRFLNNNLFIEEEKNCGGGTGIRTQTAYAYTGFQDRPLAIRTSLRKKL